jgi:hypothetical protein
MAKPEVPRVHDNHPWPQDWGLCGPACVNPDPFPQKEEDGVDYWYCDQVHGCHKDNCRCVIFWWDDRDPGKKHEKPWKTEGKDKVKVDGNLHPHCYCAVKV